MLTCVGGDNSQLFKEVIARRLTKTLVLRLTVGDIYSLPLSKPNRKLHIQPWLFGNFSTTSVQQAACLELNRRSFRESGECVHWVM